jgi:ABC-type sulfate transport system substrate-binding protein
MNRNLVAGLLLVSAAKAAWAQATLLNVSYDVTREFYKDYNHAFAAFCQGAGASPGHVQETRPVHD